VAQKGMFANDDDHEVEESGHQLFQNIIPKFPRRVEENYDTFNSGLVSVSRYEPEMSAVQSSDGNHFRLLLLLSIPYVV
jgi:hypothetical protein